MANIVPTDDLIQFTELLPPAPRYKRGMGNLALVASDGRGTICLDYIGAGVTFEISESGRNDSDIFEGAPIGISVWDGTYDSEDGLDGTFRPLTDEEWDSYNRQGVIWDSAAWYE